MKKLLFLISSFSLFAAVAAAGTVTFSTSGVFNCNGVSGCSTSNGGATLSDNGLTLVYTTASNSVNAPTFASFGSLTTTGSLGANVLDGITFTLTINQTVPSVGTGTLTAATLTGGITSTSSSGAFISFQAPTYSLTIGGNSFTGPGVQIASPIGPITYIVPNNPLAIVPQSTNNGVTTIQGAVADTPEPVTFTLVGAGLGLAGLLRRRRAA